MMNYEDEYGVLDMSEEAMNTLELMSEKLDNDGCGPGNEDGDKGEIGDNIKNDGSSKCHPEK